MPWYSYSTCSQCSLVGHENPSVLRAKKRMLKEKRKLIQRKSRYITSTRQQNFLISTACGPANVAGKKWQKLHVWLFLCIIALRNKTVALSSIVRQCKWLSLPRKIVEIQNFCYHGNMTSHFSSPFSALVTERIWIKHYSCPQKQTNQYHNS